MFSQLQTLKLVANWLLNNPSLEKLKNENGIARNFIREQITLTGLLNFEKSSELIEEGLVKDGPHLGILWNSIKEFQILRSVRFSKKNFEVELKRFHFLQKEKKLGRKRNFFILILP